MLSRKFYFSLKESFGLKMLASFIVVIVVVLSAFTLFAVIHASNRAKAGLREQGEMLSGLLAHGAVVGVFAENEKMLATTVEGALDLKDVVSISIYNARLKILYAKSKTPSGKNASPPHQDSAPDLEAAQSTSVIETTHTFEVVRPVMIKSASKTDESLYFGGAAKNESEKVIGYVRIVLSKDSYHKETLALLMRNAVILLVLIFSSIIIIHLAVKNITGPLKKLTQSVKALEKGLPVEQVSVETTDEVGNLASAFNIMVVARGQAENELRQSEQRFRLIAETIAEVFWIADVDLSRMIYVSPAYERVWGRSRESLYENPRLLFDAVHEEDRERMLAVLESRKTGGTFEFEYRIVRPDGAVRVVWESGYPVRDEEGRLTSYVGVAHDITERKKMEMEMRIKDSAIAASINGIAISDLQGTIRYANRSYVTMLGYEEESEILGKPLSTFAESAEQAEIIREALRTRGGWVGELTGRRKDGTLVPRLMSASLVTDEAGRPINVLGSFIDITERKQAEEALRSNRETLQKIIDGSSAVIFAKDLDGKYLFINSLFEQLFHVSKSEIIGKTDRDIFPAETAAALKEADLKALQAGTTIETEEKVPQDDGLHYYISLKFPLYDNSGKPYAVCGMATDITERKRAEEKLRLYHEQLVALTLELSRTEARERRSIAIDLHDTVGQELAVAKIKLALLQRVVPSGIIARDLDEVRSQLDRAIQYTRSLTVELSPPTLYDFGLEAAVEDLASQIQERHALPVTVKKSGCARDELSEELRILLYKTIRELLMNVVKHAAASKTSIAIQDDGRQISVIVEDNGKGFEAVKNDLHPDRHGGFGLFSIRERLRLLGGRLEVESAPGMGTRVVVTAPSRDQGKKGAE